MIAMSFLLIFGRFSSEFFCSVVFLMAEGIYTYYKLLFIRQIYFLSLVVLPSSASSSPLLRRSLSNDYLCHLLFSLVFCSID